MKSMTKEQADLAQRYNVGCILDREGYEGKILYIKELIRGRVPWKKDDFQYSVTLWNKNEPRHSVVTVEISKVQIMPGFDKFIENKLKEREERQAMEELKKELTA